MEHVESRWAGLLGRLALAAVATLFVFGALEVVLRGLGYEPIFRVYSHPEVFWQRDDLLGWSLEPGAHGTFVGPRPWPIEYQVPVQINSLGLRGPELAELPPNGIRIMVLGDSVVAGFEVPEDRTFSALLASRLTASLGVPVQVINAGVRGYGADQSYLYYKERGSRLEPDFVVYLPTINDLSDNITLHRMRRVFSKGALEPHADGSLAPVGYPIPEYPLCSEWLLDADFQPRRIDSSVERAVCWIQSQLADRSALLTFVSLRIRQNPTLLEFLYHLGSAGGAAEWLPKAERSGSQHPDDVAPLEVLNIAILRALGREVKKNGAVLMLPMRSPFAPPLDPQDFASGAIATFDIDVDFSLPDYHYKNDGHLNENGHDVMAQLLEKVILERIRGSGARAGIPAPGGSASLIPTRE